MKISIITASYESGETIADTIRSIDEQTHSDWSHQIVDGGSSDGTLNVCSRYTDNRRRVVSQEDEGVYDAMNKGIAQATGDVVGFLNADDFYEASDVLSAVVEAFEDPGVDLVYGNLRYVASDDSDYIVRDWVPGPFTPGMFRRGWVPPHPTVFARREVFARVGMFDLRFSIAADWDWLFRVLEIAGMKSLYLDKYLVRMRLGGVSNSSISNVLESNRETIQAFRKHGERVPLGFFPGKITNRGRQFLMGRKR